MSPLSSALRIDTSRAAPQTGPAGVFALRRQGYRARVESVFAVARPIIMAHRGAVDRDGRPMLGPTMAWEDWLAMTDGHPAVASCMEVFRSETGRILAEFGLNEYHVIPEEMRFSGRAEDALVERTLHDARSSILTAPGSRVVLHPATWAKLDALAAGYRARFGEPLSVASGYRSDAYQLYLLAYYASRMDDLEHPGKKLPADRSLEDVCRTVAPPFSSEHSMRVPAFDIGNFMDQPHELRSTERWKWFRDAALELGIIESYPDGTINNGYGEPWHFSDRTSD